MLYVSHLYCAFPYAFAEHVQFITIILASGNHFHLPVSFSSLFILPLSFCSVNLCPTRPLQLHFLNSNNSILVMPYTQARLQHALRAYRESKTREIEFGHSPNIRRHLRSNYNLRQVAPSLKIVPAVTWQDDESSADEYLPSTPRKRRHLASARKTPKRVKQTTDQNHGTESLPDEQEKVDLPSLLVTLKLKSDAGKKLLGGPADTLGTGYESNIKGGGWNSVQGEESLGRLDPPDPQEGHRIKAAQDNFSNCDNESEKIDNKDGRVLRNGKILDEDRVVSQRCSACRAARKKCVSALGKPGILSCVRCSQKEVECDMGNGEVALKEEREDDIDSDVTPRSGPRRLQRPSPDVKSGSVGMESPTKTPTSRALASQFVKPHVSPPRQNPLLTQIGASFDNPIVLDSPPSSPRQAEFYPPAEATGRIVVITTPWAHPVQYKHIPTKTKPCHFCLDFRYGIYGYGKITVEVIRYPSFQGQDTGAGQYEETGNGHRARGREATRMCVSCALSRLYISRCNNHRFKQFLSHSPERLLQYNGQVQVQPFHPPLKVGAYPTCSICPKAALWKCCSKQQFDKVGRALSPEDCHGQGCGLVLCHECRANVIGKGELTLPVKGLCRADAEFLFPGSALHMAYGKLTIDLSTYLLTTDRLLTIATRTEQACCAPRQSPCVVRL
ncbi:hypothetical protein HRR94_005530 [Exophiala dermatitidis]|nr:hypothetical protein HRR94_005530 [Exophiala dermatitidis]